MKHLLCLIALVFFLGCQSKPAEKVVVKIGDYVVTREEFDDAFKSSSYGAHDDPVSRQAFLQNMINQKLIILDAQARGLDKDKDFLRMIQNFWEQSLVTVALQSKTKEGGNLDQWADYLRKNTKIEINEEYLK